MNLQGISLRVYVQQRPFQPSTTHRSSMGHDDVWDRYALGKSVTQGPVQHAQMHVYISKVRALKKTAENPNQMLSLITPQLWVIVSRDKLNKKMWMTQQWDIMSSFLKVSAVLVVSWMETDLQTSREIFCCSNPTFLVVFIVRISTKFHFEAHKS